MSIETYDAIAAECELRRYDIRHGKSIHNGGDIFYGGSPDDGPDGPVTLDPLGESQGRAVGWLMKNLGIPVVQAFRSDRERTKQTSELAAEAYGFSGVTVLPGLHEVDHGRQQSAGLPKGQAKAEHAETTQAFLDLLKGFDCLGDEQLRKYADWLTPKGWGDSIDSYFSAGLRAAIATAGLSGVIFGHHGSQRQSRALTERVNRTDLQELAERHAAMAGAIEMTSGAVGSFYEQHGRRPGFAELPEMLMPLAEASAPLIVRLGELAVPAIDDVVREGGALGNGTVAEVGIQPDGTTVRGRLWIPRVLDETVGLASNTVTVMPGSEWV